MYRYRILDQLPTLPENLYQHAINILEQGGKDVTINPTNSEYTSRVLKRGDESFPSTYTHRVVLGEEFKQWVRDNIVSSWTECSISKTWAAISHCQGPHTDKTREFVLMYVIDSGGEHCRTVWYQEKGQPFHRPGRQWLTINDFDLLEEKESVFLPVGQWSIINTQYLHGVENIEHDRVVIHIGLDGDHELAVKFPSLFSDNK
jgi:hypothetical protein